MKKIAVIGGGASGLPVDCSRKIKPKSSDYDI